MQNRVQSNWLKAGSALALGFLAVAPKEARAITPTACEEVLSRFNGDAVVTGAAVGKSASDWPSVFHLTAPGFAVASWNPATAPAPPFVLAGAASHLGGNYQEVQTAVTSGGGFSAQAALWISRNGRVWHRSLSDETDWFEWENVQCYSVRSNRMDWTDGQPLGRFILTAFNPYGGYFMSLDVREMETLQ